MLTVGPIRRRSVLACCLARKEAGREEEDRKTTNLAVIWEDKRPWSLSLCLGSALRGGRPLWRPLILFSSELKPDPKRLASEVLSSIKLIKTFRA